MAIELEDAVERAIELALPVAAVSAAEDEAVLGLCPAVHRLRGKGWNWRWHTGCWR